MVFVPLGVLTGVPGVTWEKFLLNNLLPVTVSGRQPAHALLSTALSFTPSCKSAPHLPSVVR